VELDRDRLRNWGWIAAAVVAVVVAFRVLSGGGEGSTAVTVDPSGPAKPGATGSAPAPAGSGPALVHVAGEVRRPGVYRVPPGGRVNDAVQLAGGLTSRAEQAGVNLVARVTDGQQVVVPRRGAAAGGSGGSGGSGGAPTGAAPPGAKVSLGSATLEQLESIDGIGPTLAKRILEYRDQHGGFRSVDELRQVDGIGEKRFESLREAVTP
jgi:competence protein ComEA